MPEISKPDSYLTKVVDEFASECDGTWESRKKLWQTVVLVYELSGDPEHWVDALTDIASNAGMRYRDIVTTLASALAHARKTGHVT